LQNTNIGQRKLKTRDRFGFDEGTQRRARRYFYFGVGISLLKWSFILNLTFLAISLRLSIFLEKFIAMSVSQLWLGVALYVSVGYGLFLLISLPFDFYKECALEQKFGLSSRTLGKWAFDKLKNSFLPYLLILFLCEGVYNSMGLNLAWVVGSVGVVSAFFVLALFRLPGLIDSHLYKSLKLKDEELLNRLTKLSAKAGIRNISIFEMKAGAKTKKAFAAVAGVAKARRILLSDTLLSNYSKDEIESILGHEIGHSKLGDQWKFPSLLSIIITVDLFVTYQIAQATHSLFGFERIDSIAALPLLALIFGLVSVGFIPLLKIVSRRAEGHCDQYELDLVEKPDAYLSSLVKLCDQNLNYAYPNAFVEFVLYDHPSGGKRIERALAYKQFHVLK
jgi:STE24 endopeptidase